MNNLKYLTAYIVVFVIIVLSASLSAQDSEASISENGKIILYNSKPVIVKLSGDKIKSFIGEAPAKYMDGYNTGIFNRGKQVVKNSIENIIISETVEVNADYAIISNKKVLLNYQEGFATLDKAMINKLNEISLHLKSDTGAKVLLISYHISDNATGSKLAENRLGAAVAYLKIKGISLDRIKTDTQKSSVLKDVISVNYLK